jgi:membrane fusion protein (multidrug efflux system)
MLAVAVAAGALGASGWWYAEARNQQSTDDAYVAGDVVQITSEQAGTVISVNVDDTQGVQRDQSLVELDPVDARVAMQSAEAELARSVRQVRGTFAQADQLKAQIAQAEIDLQRARADYQRRAGLAEGGAVSREELAHAQQTLDLAQATLTSAREQLNVTNAQIDGTTVDDHPQVLAAAAKVRDATIAMHRTAISAPVAGVVARRSVQVGQRIAAGTPLMAVIPLDDVWVDANFKEVQLENMRVGQPVTLHADVYGTDTVYHGHVAGLSAGSGSAFALLPAQNASGNWIKIVQRVPVRIALDAGELHAHPLRIGLSMGVEVDVRDTSGPLVASSVRTLSSVRQASIGDDPDAEARIARIVASNGGPMSALGAVATVAGAHTAARSEP